MRPSEGYLLFAPCGPCWSKLSASEMTLPLRTRRAAATMSSGAVWLSVPISSAGPQRPQFLYFSAASARSLRVSLRAAILLLLSDDLQAPRTVARRREGGCVLDLDAHAGVEPARNAEAQSPGRRLPLHHTHDAPGIEVDGERRAETAVFEHERRAGEAIEHSLARALVRLAHCRRIARIGDVDHEARARDAAHLVHDSEPLARLDIGEDARPPHDSVAQRVC